MDEMTQYKNVLSDLIKKQIIMLGPNVALAQARKIPGFSINDQGDVTEIKDNPQQVLSSVAKQYMALSGAIAQMTLDSLIAKYPNVKINPI